MKIDADDYYTASLKFAEDNDCIEMDCISGAALLRYLRFRFADLQMQILYPECNIYDFGNMELTIM